MLRCFVIESSLQDGWRDYKAYILAEDEYEAIEIFTERFGINKHIKTIDEIDSPGIFITEDYG